jgi:cyclopropane fatty-acyl-phospholipid synthase-like methyltransferase
MTSLAAQQTFTVEERARQSLGKSDQAIYEMVAASLRQRQIKCETLIDVGCGAGNLRPFVQPFCARYVGVTKHSRLMPNSVPWI